MQGASHQQAGHFVSRAPAVQQDRFTVLDQFDRPLGNGLLLRPARRLRNIEMGEFRRCAGIKHSAMGPPGGSLLFELVDVAADGGFRHLERLGQLRERGEPPDTNQLQQPVATFFGEHGA